MSVRYSEKKFIFPWVCGLGLLDTILGPSKGHTQQVTHWLDLLSGRGEFSKVDDMERSEPCHSKSTSLTGPQRTSTRSSQPPLQHHSEKKLLPNRLISREGVSLYQTYTLLCSRKWNRQSTFPEGFEIWNSRFCFSLPWGPCVRNLESLGSSLNSMWLIIPDYHSKTSISRIFIQHCKTLRLGDLFFIYVIKDIMLYNSALVLCHLNTQKVSYSSRKSWNRLF